MTCWICEEHEKCPYGICYTQEAESNNADQELDETDQLELKL